MTWWLVVWGNIHDPCLYPALCFVQMKKCKSMNTNMVYTCHCQCLTVAITIAVSIANCSCLGRKLQEQLLSKWVIVLQISRNCILPVITTLSPQLLQFQQQLPITAYWKRRQQYCWLKEIFLLLLVWEVDIFDNSWWYVTGMTLTFCIVVAFGILMDLDEEFDFVWLTVFLWFLQKWQIHWGEWWTFQWGWDYDGSGWVCGIHVIFQHGGDRFGIKPFWRIIKLTVLCACVIYSNLWKLGTAQWIWLPACTLTLVAARKSAFASMVGG